MLGEVASAGNRIKTLEALRDRLAEEIDNCHSSRDVAALARRLQSVLAELDDMPQIDSEPAADHLRRRRDERRAQFTNNPIVD